MEENYLEIITSANNDEHEVRVIGITWAYNISKNIEDAVINMAAEYEVLRFIGYKDGHHFCITNVINEITHKELTEDEVEYMYYIAHGPECISIRIDDIDFFEYMGNGY